MAKDIQAEDGTMRVKRVIGGGVEIIKAPPPTVVTVAHELGQPRKVSLCKTMQRAQKMVAKWSVADLGPPHGKPAWPKRLALWRAFTGRLNAVKCEFVEGGTLLSSDGHALVHSGGGGSVGRPPPRPAKCWAWHGIWPMTAAVLLEPCLSAKIPKIWQQASSSTARIASTW